jgi:hypothetical protein
MNLCPTLLFEPPDTILEYIFRCRDLNAVDCLESKGLFGKWRIQVDGRGLNGILENL